MEEDLGQEAANELFAMLQAIDYSDLPHDLGVQWDCYLSLVKTPSAF